MKVTREGYAIPQGVHTLGGDPGAPAEAPPSPDCCADPEDVPDRALEPSVAFIWSLGGDVVPDASSVVDGVGDPAPEVYDGDDGTYASNPNSERAHITVDFGAARTITGFRVLATGNQFADDDTPMELYASATPFVDSEDEGDEIVWSGTIDLPNDGDPPEEVTDTFPAESYRYWRIQTFSPGQGTRFFEFALYGEDEWIPGGDRAVDEDDATYVEADGTNVLLVDLGGPFEIVRTRLRIGTETAGSKAYVISAANEADLSDETTIATLNFTGTGSYTAQDVTATWDAAGAFQYWILTGPDESRRVFSWELYEGTLETNHQHSLDGISDVDTSGAVEGSVLVYDADTDTWVVGAVTGDHGGLSGLADDDHPQYIRATDGGGEVVNTVAASGSTETLDLADGNVHDVTLTANCTFTFTGAAAGRSRSFLLYLRQDGVGGRTATWPGSVIWAAGSAPTLSASPSAVDRLVFSTIDGGTSWIGDVVGAGSGGTPASTVEDETTFGISPAVGADTEYARQDHTHGTPGEAEVRDIGRWEPVTDGEVEGTELVFEDGDIVMEWVSG